MIKTFIVNGMKCRHCKDDIFDVLMTYPNVSFVTFEQDILSIELNSDLCDEEIIETIENCGNYIVKKRS